MRPDLPIYYYHDHFIEMVGFVERVYDTMLDQTHRAFLSGFRRLTRDQQCLYIRMANRKGAAFQFHDLRYAEIGDIPSCIAALSCQGFLRAPGDGDYGLLLAGMKKEALAALARHCGGEWRASWPKARLAGFVQDGLSFERFCAHVDPSTIVIREHCETLAFLLYLYFGKSDSDLKNFALRDLGIMQVRDKESGLARFADAAEASDCFLYSRMIQRLEGKAEVEIAACRDLLLQSTPPLSDYAANLRARAAFRLGQLLEKRKDLDSAIAVYRLAASGDCNERLVRLLYAMPVDTMPEGQEEARILLERMIDDPESDAEFTFASDFYDRKFRRQRIGACTYLLRNVPVLYVDEAHRNAPESAAASAFRREGWRVYHTENTLWRTLFGLLFWDEIFAPESLHSGFDRVPQCLKDRSFSTRFGEAIASKLDRVRARNAITILLQGIASHMGTANGVFSWNDIDIDACQDLLVHGDGAATAAMLQWMCDDFPSCRDGFPDLMLARDGTIRFVEIKAEGDAIRRHQLTRLNQMRRAGFDADIRRVEYRYDPDQTYVVVDIETTGGRAASERITEIGAVKIRNHRVIGEYHSLLNPGRRIPAFITRLTGISDAMVADAPRFAEIADDFEDFTADCVFVAHNVNFDYGFIAAEYRRLDRSYKRPKFCTCAEMRRHHPGHASYSLGNLCGALSIALDNHHRALCDARAAAELLAHINRKRENTALAAAS